MSNDSGLIAKLEQWMVDTIAALDLFKTVDVWKHQTGLDGSFTESFARYEPFAFVAYIAATAAREGGYDLREVLEFGVVIGVESKEPGVARLGDDNNKGISSLRDSLIATFDRTRPDDETVTCDEFYFMSDLLVVDSPKRCALEMRFECSQMTAVN